MTGRRFKNVFYKQHTMMGTGLARGRPRVSAVSKRSGLDSLSVGSTGYSSITNFRCPDLRAPWARLMAAGRPAREGLGLEDSDLPARISCIQRVKKPVLWSLESSWGLQPGASSGYIFLPLE